MLGGQKIEVSEFGEWILRVLRTAIVNQRSNGAVNTEIEFLDVLIEAINQLENVHIYSVQFNWYYKMIHWMNHFG